MTKKDTVLSNDYIIDEKPIFGKGLSFYKLFAIFVLASIFGTFYEQILYFLQSSLTNDSWDFSALFYEQKGLIYGPFNPIYGFPAVIAILILTKTKRPWYKTFIIGSLIGGGLEYGISFLEELFTNNRSWDYSDLFLNINGRTTIPIMIFWGLLCLLLAEVIYPPLSNLIEKIPYRFGMILSKILIVFLSINCLLTGGAILRGSERFNGNKPITFIGKFFDWVYDDDFLITNFPDTFKNKQKG